MQSAVQPSFLIQGGSASAPPALRLDRINSQEVLRQARSVLFHYQHDCPAGPEPCGVVLHQAGGRVVFERPVLLPDEQFVPLELLRSRASKQRSSRLRMPRLE
ncbi:MAG: hypothetical protein VKI63_02220 [Cyanobium sp.]|nr:hypothetical protein [Cyanobium sp.]